MTVLRFENDLVQRARAVDLTQVKPADRGLRLQPFVRRSIWKSKASLVK